MSLLLNNSPMKTAVQRAEEDVLAEKSSKDYSDVATAPALPKIDSNVSQVEQKGKVASSQTTGRKIYFGFAFETRSQTRVKEVEGQIGRKFDLLMTYVQWGNPQNSKIDTNFFSVFTSENKVPIITWEPWNPAAGVNQSNYKLSNITSGNFDPYIRSSAQAIKTYNKPIFVRFAHEMNGNWYPWGGTVNGNKPQDYVVAYQHIYNIFSQELVSNVTWVWCPVTWSVPNLNGNELLDYYPGTGFVDWVGLDGYNFGTSMPGQKWQSFTSLFSSGYQKVLSLNKPIMIAETASSESGGDKGAWIASTLATELPQNFPAIKALIWFDINKETSWDINSSPNSISHFKSQINSEAYKATIKTSNSKIASP